MLTKRDCPPQRARTKALSSVCLRYEISLDDFISLLLDKLLVTPAHRVHLKLVKKLEDNPAPLFILIIHDVIMMSFIAAVFHPPY